MVPRRSPPRNPTGHLHGAIHRGRPTRASFLRHDPSGRPQFPAACDRDAERTTSIRRVDRDGSNVSAGRWCGSRRRRLLAVLGNLLHPRYVNTSSVDMYRSIGGSSLVRTSDLVLVVALVGTTAGFIALAQSLSAGPGPGGVMARYGSTARRGLCRRPERRHVRHEAEIGHRGIPIEGLDSIANQHDVVREEHAIWSRSCVTRRSSSSVRTLRALLSRCSIMGQARSPRGRWPARSECP